MFFKKSPSCRGARTPLGGVRPHENAILTYYGFRSASESEEAAAERLCLGAKCLQREPDAGAAGVGPGVLLAQFEAVLAHGVLEAALGQEEVALRTPRGCTRARHREADETRLDQALFVHFLREPSGNNASGALL